MTDRRRSDNGGDDRGDRGARDRGAGRGVDAAGEAAGVDRAAGANGRDGPTGELGLFEAFPAGPPARPAEPVEDGPSGHRKRLRQRFRDGGPDAVPDYELLEMVLYGAFPRQDTKPLAKRLIARFGSFAGVVNAAPERLKEVDGCGERAIGEIKLVRAAALRLMKGEIMGRPVLGSWSAVVEYLRAAQGHDTRESLRILFLDKKNQLIADEVQQEGTVDHAPVYVREVVRRAIELAATAIILVHNHPSGDPTPSKADVDMTRQIIDAAKPLGVLVHDHIIVGRSGHASLKGLKLI